VEDLFGSHANDDVGMRADPDAVRRDMAQNRIEIAAVPATVERVDPDERTRAGQKTIANVLARGFGVDHRLDREVATLQRQLNGIESRVLGHASNLSGRVAPPDDGHL